MSFRRYIHCKNYHVLNVRRTPPLYSSMTDYIKHFAEFQLVIFMTLDDEKATAARKRSDVFFDYAYSGKAVPMYKLQGILRLSMVQIVGAAYPIENDTSERRINKLKQLEIVALKNTRYISLLNTALQANVLISTFIMAALGSGAIVILSFIL